MSIKRRLKLTSKLKNRAACLIVEENLPCMNGIALLEHINSLGFRLPTFVLSSDCDLSKAVRAMQAQAIDFIEKPFIENCHFGAIAHGDQLILDHQIHSGPTSKSYGS